MLRASQAACRFTALAVGMILLVAMSSCGGGSADTESVVLSDSAQGPIPMDSALMLADADSVAPKEEEKPAPLRIRSKAEIDEYIASSPDRARYEAGIIPTMAEYVPEYASKLLDNTHDGFLIVDKNTMKLYRYDRYGVLLESVGIACSKYYGTKHKKADNRTPEGFFTIKGIFNSTDWLYTNDEGVTSPAKGQFGPRFMRLDTPVSQQIGIHGTASPGSIGGRRSHGCIRMTNDNIMRIHKLCESGMPVIVSPGPRDMAVNESEGYDVPSVPVTKGGVPCRPGKVSEADKEKKKENNATGGTEPVKDTIETPENRSVSQPTGEEAQPAPSRKEETPATSTPDPAPASASESATEGIFD